MTYYLSSYKFGDKVEALKNILFQGAKIGHINNSQDWTTANPEIRDNHLKEEMEFMDNLGCISEHLDLKDYFGKENKLRNKIASLDGIWVCGGNTFVLRQAMKLSGFDNIFIELQKRDDFFYGGYSAGVCILSDSLKYIQCVDNPNDFPYKEITETIWEGLNVFNYGILPHYDSEHPESEDIEREVKRCINNKWLFKTLRDGEVIIIE
ncbi:Type 1 glutamine amidotransferase-like domain-containing protein [Tamlana sp. 2201CG12-4]|uniref:Type 1 glutamine amidotransferase-like domain-containing protein n=1 Tax=Tamlana sp. 2201CG12-4 TaxID=3112582 RepID=UPI002DBAA6E1|nr:Type 1 glutamine amidotransferase-like domain-containing protein [Tamlana sp. 2201CG12-4]MEC3906070.1 Type 1 glutamine amidotransferase-like domain-containing protein [Tamlana sp. 2201CG12-4]